MRWHRLLLLGLAGCGGAADTSSQNDLPVQTFTVTGLVRDSVLGSPLAGIRVLVGDSAVITDAAGRFTTIYRGGRTSIIVNDGLYEPYLANHDLVRNIDVILELAGQAPYVIGCGFSGDSVTATMLDLQGRKTINRRAASYLLARSGPAIIQNDAYSWHWNPIDNITWRTNVPLGGPADSVDWTLEDGDGNTRFTRCVKQPPPCQGCASRPVAMHPGR
ncbi:MAG: hypothetical protein ABI679_01975 [Gemmatimonadota bacterium]